MKNVVYPSGRHIAIPNPGHHKLLTCRRTLESIIITNDRIFGSLSSPSPSGSSVDRTRRVLCSPSSRVMPCVPNATDERRSMTTGKV